MAARILVIEDNENNRKLMVYLLKSFHYEVLAANDGVEGVAAIVAELPDLIICDLEMPRKDGYEVAHEIKSKPQTKTIPLIAVTAFAMVGDREKILKGGFDGYISKPIDPQTFVSQVEAFLPMSRRNVRGEKGN